MRLLGIATERTRRGDAASLTPEDAQRHFREHPLRPGSGTGRVGVELEWLVHARDDAQAAVSFPDLMAATEAAGPPPSGGRVTFEPGGQLEVSGPPRPGPAAACAAVAADLAVLGPALTERGLVLSGIGLDPARTPRRVVDNPRYRAMEAYFDVHGRAGRQMMCSTAAVQVNLDPGPDPAVTWRLAHSLGAVLAAAFANSPVLAGGPSGWRSTRLTTWWAVDPTRTRPVGGPDPETAWADYALGARVMLIPGGDFRPVLEPLTFSQWIAHPHQGVSPALGDLEYHLTTLFPPIRPRGFLELRMVDALPEPWWRVPVAVSAALLGHPELTGAVAEATAPADGWWRTAARYGLSHPVLAGAARRCFELAADALGAGPDARLVPVVEAYRQRWVDRGRCPADDVMAAWEAGTRPPVPTGSRNAGPLGEDEYACRN